jgi:uncharacterized protein with GYD domain
VPKFLVVADYSAAGAKGVQSKGGSDRVAAVEQAIQGIGGTMESFYFAFGPHDAYVVSDLPDNASAAALALAVNTSGGATVETIVLLTAEEVDAAAQKSVGYRAPGS